jgi:Flp pilus assembly protein TadD
LRPQTRLNPADAAAHPNLGVVYLRLGKRAEALAQHATLQKLNPQLADKLYALINK